MPHWHGSLSSQQESTSAARGALIALGLIAANVAIRCSRAIQGNVSAVLQKTVGLMLLQIVLIDGAMTFCVTGSAQLAASVVILIIPAVALKRKIPMS